MTEKLDDKFNSFRVPKILKQAVANRARKEVRQIQQMLVIALWREFQSEIEEERAKMKR